MLKAEIKDKLNELVGDEIGIDAKEELNAMEQIVELLVIAFDRLEDQKNHSHSIT